MSNTHTAKVRTHQDFLAPEPHTVIVRFEVGRAIRREILPLNQCLNMFSEKVGVGGFYLTLGGTLVTPLETFHDAEVLNRGVTVTIGVLLPTRIEGVGE